MSGFWGGSASGDAVLRSDGQPVSLGMNCTLNWSFNSQAGGTFSGSLSARGGSPTSDWRCAHQGNVTGQIEADGRLSIRFDPPFTPGGCTNIVAPDTMTGQMDGDDAFTVMSSGTATCQMFLGNPDPAHIRDVSYTMTVSGRRR
jgi:hypothetical protein